MLTVLCVDIQVTFDDFKEGFVAVLSQAIEQLSSSEDEDQPSDVTAGMTSSLHLYCITLESLLAAPLIHLYMYASDVQ